MLAYLHFKAYGVEEDVKWVKEYLEELEKL